VHLLDVEGTHQSAGMSYTSCSSYASCSFSPTTCAVILDVRGTDEWDRGHVSCATRLQVQDKPAGWEDDVLALVKGVKTTPIIAYCAAGVRAEAAVTALQEAGYSSVSNGGGYEGNKEALEKVCEACKSEAQGTAASGSDTRAASTPSPTPSAGSPSAPNPQSSVSRQTDRHIRLNIHPLTHTRAHTQICLRACAPCKPRDSAQMSLQSCGSAALCGALAAVALQLLPSALCTALPPSGTIYTSFFPLLLPASARFTPLPSSGTFLPLSPLLCQF